jgi:hypothetical protein
LEGIIPAGQRTRPGGHGAAWRNETIDGSWVGTGRLRAAKLTSPALPIRIARATGFVQSSQFVRETRLRRYVSDIERDERRFTYSPIRLTRMKRGQAAGGAPPVRSRYQTFSFTPAE